MIIREWRKSGVMSHPFQMGVAKTLHLSEKAVTSAMGRELPFPLDAAWGQCKKS